MNKLVCFAYVFASFAHAEIKTYDNPNKLQCGPGKEVWDVLKTKYGEDISLVGSSANKVGEAESVMFFMTNPETATYSFVNFYPASNIACVVDTGTLHKKKVTSF